MTGRIRTPEIIILLMAAALLEALLARLYPLALIVDLPLILTFYVGWNSPPFKSALSGTGFGLLRDAVLGLSLGLNGISKAIIGFLASYLNRWTATEGLGARVLWLTLLAVIDDLIVLVLKAAFRIGAWPDLSQMTLETAATALAAAVVFRTYDRLRFPQRDFSHLR